LKPILIGIIFAALWASASTATKFGIRAADPLILANVRFLVAGPLLLLISTLFFRKSAFWPRRFEWPQLLVFALLNTTIYLGAFVISLREVSAGIGSLSTATGPLFVLMLSALWLNRKLKNDEILGVVLGLSGAALATFPLLQNSQATLKGLVILMGGIVSVSAASVYYARVKWELGTVALNGWQVLIGGLLLLPFTAFFANWPQTHWDIQFWLSVSWLIVPVSIGALQLWFYLLRQDAVRASLWLFLCPIFGFTYSHILLNEPLSWHTFAGTVLVVFGLYVAQREKFK